MYADRHARPGGINPGSLGIALALNGAALAALLLAAPETFVLKRDRPLIADNFPLAPPPPPQPPQARTKPRPDPRLTTPDPMTKPPIADDPRIDFPLPPQPPFPDPGPIQGAGSDPDTGHVVITPPPPRLVGVSLDPRYADALQPPYPPEEIRAERDGKVVVKVLVGVDGRVKDVARVSATSDAFFRATERQARSRWRFRPATQGGVPVEQWFTMSVSFVLSG